MVAPVTTAGSGPQLISFQDLNEKLSFFKPAGEKLENLVYGVRCTPLYILPATNLHSPRIKRHGCICGSDPLGHGAGLPKLRFAGGLKGNGEIFKNNVNFDEAADEVVPNVDDPSFLVVKHCNIGTI